MGTSCEICLVNRELGGVSLRQHSDGEPEFVLSHIAASGVAMNFMRLWGSSVYEGPVASARFRPDLVSGVMILFDSLIHSLITREVTKENRLEVPDLRPAMSNDYVPYIYVVEMIGGRRGKRGRWDVEVYDIAELRKEMNKEFPEIRKAILRKEVRPNRVITLELPDESSLGEMKVKGMTEEEEGRTILLLQYLRRYISKEDLNLFDRIVENLFASSGKHKEENSVKPGSEEEERLIS